MGVVSGVQFRLWGVILESGTLCGEKSHPLPAQACRKQTENLKKATQSGGRLFSLDLQSTDNDQSTGGEDASGRSVKEGGPEGKTAPALKSAGKGVRGEGLKGKNCVCDWAKHRGGKAEIQAAPKRGGGGGEEVADAARGTHPNVRPPNKKGPLKR